ncbi:MAG: hypothetical protein O9350_23800 [Microcystis sp. LE19-388.1G]|nr:hypothetical protein [Microcystis sp. LE19-388.1G]
MATSKLVKPHTPHPTPYPHEKLFQQTLVIKSNALASRQIKGLESRLVKGE